MRPEEVISIFLGGFAIGAMIFMICFYIVSKLGDDE